MGFNAEVTPRGHVHHITDVFNRPANHQTGRTEDHILRGNVFWQPVDPFLHHGERAALNDRNAQVGFALFIHHAGGKFYIHRSLIFSFKGLQRFLHQVWEPGLQHQLLKM